MNTATMLCVAMEVCGLIICLIISWILAIQKNRSRIDRDIQVLVFLSALLMTSDSLTIALRGTESQFGFFVLRLSNLVVYLVNYSILIAYGRCIYDYTNPGKKGIQIALYNVVGFVSIGSMLFVVGSQFGNWLYYFDDAHYYHRTSLYPLSQIAPVVSAVCFSYILVLNKKKMYINQFYATCSYVVLPLITAVIQTAVYGYPIQNLSILVSSWILFCAREIDVRNQLEDANKAKTIFLNNMSHDIRTPMNAIIGFTNIAKKYNPNPEVENCLEKIEKSSEHLLTLINDVLDISRIESGKITCVYNSTDMNDVVDSVLDVIRGFMLDRKLDFQVHRSIPRYRYVLADEVHIKEILINILSNAVKFTDDGGRISFETILYPGKDTEHVSVLFRIADTGVGMSEEFQKKVFDEFAQEDNGARTQYKGTGLGLSIANKLAILMGGRIFVKSKKGEGSTFTVELPMRITEKAAIQKNTHTHLRVELSGKRVLLAEDNDLNAEIVTIQLKEYGVEITRAVDGEDAVRIFSSNPPGSFDIILMDIMMPRMNGYEATKAIRTLEGRPDGKNICIIAMTANAFEEDVQASLAAGMNAHLSKPISVDDVVKTIADFVDK